MQGRKLERVWKALADRTRRRIIDLLSRGPRTTGEIATAVPRLSRFAVMKHLRVLERAGLVLPRKDGRQVWNHLNAVPLREVYERWVGQSESAAAGALLRIKRQVEGRPGPGVDDGGLPWSLASAQPATAGPPGEVAGAPPRLAAQIEIDADIATLWRLLTSAAPAALWRSCIRPAPPGAPPLSPGAACLLCLHPAASLPGVVTGAHLREHLAAVSAAADNPVLIDYRLQFLPGRTRVTLSVAWPGAVPAAVDQRFVLDSLFRLRDAAHA